MVLPSILPNPKVILPSYINNIPNPMSSIAFPLAEVPQPDSFEPSVYITKGHVATATIYPTQSQVGAFMANVLSDGTITKKGLMGEETLGLVDIHGNYRLINGLKGNVFERKEVDLSGLEENLHPFARALQSAKQQRAIRGSEIPLIRSQLTSRGITGQGIKVGILDPLKKKDGQWQSSNHTQMVKQIINDPVWGVAPGAAVQELGEQWEPDLTLTGDTLQALHTMIIGDYVNLFTRMSEKLQKTLQYRDPALRVLNLTYGSDRVMTYLDIWKKINDKDENSHFKNPNLRTIILGSTLYGTKEQQFQNLINYCDKILDNSPVIHQAYQQYVNMTQNAAQNGLILVIAVGNEHNYLPIKAQLRPGSEMNDLAKSPYVIRVGAASTNQTPGNYFNYRMAPFSSRGDGNWNPTIVSPGTEMGISFSQETEQATIQGTSSSTPFTCGVIALMLQCNPNLTFEKIKQKLESTATKNSQYGLKDYGAGFMSPWQAILSP